MMGHDYTVYCVFLNHYLLVMEIPWGHWKEVAVIWSQPQSIPGFCDFNSP